MSMQQIDLKFNVVMITKNPNIEWFKNAVQSFANQTYKNKHLIVVDASDDYHRNHILELISEYSEKISFVLQSGSGIWSAFKEGYALCDGDIIGVLNSDDYLANNFVFDLLATEFNRGEVDYIYGRSLRVDELGRELYIHKPPFILCKKLYDYYVFVISHHALYFKRDVFSLIDFPENDLSGPPDLLFIRNLFKSKFKGREIKIIIACFRIHTQNFSNSYSFAGTKHLFSKLTRLPQWMFFISKFAILIQNPKYLLYLIKSRLL
jgi:glycosyltransferase involved in cell wall biosynthesis